MTTRTKVIYDTDPGVDDAMALYYALAHSQIDVVGITTTFGNVSVDQAVINALYLTALAQRTIPITKGVKTPWVKHGEAPPDFIHGADGLGNLPSRKATDNVADPRPSAQFIVDMARAHPGEITLVAVGPLGNLAAALKLEPDYPEAIEYRAELFLLTGRLTQAREAFEVLQKSNPSYADVLLQSMRAWVASPPASVFFDSRFSHLPRTFDQSPMYS